MTQPAVPDSGARAGVPPRTAPSMGYKAGHRLVYEFRQFRDLTLRMKQPDAVPDAPAKMSDIQLNIMQRGKLDVRVLSDILDGDSPAGWLMEFRWTEPHVETDLGSLSDPEQRRQTSEVRPLLEEEIARGTVLAEVLPSGKIRRMRALSMAPGEAQNHVLDLLSRWQVSLGQDADAAEWDVSEEDSTGTYVAHYRRLGESSSNRLVKSKSGYSKIRSAAAAPHVQRPPRAQAQGETFIDMESYPTRIAGLETVRLASSGLFFVRGHADFRLKLVSSVSGSTTNPPAQAREVRRRMDATGSDVAWINAVDPRAARRAPPPATHQEIEKLITSLKRLHDSGGKESHEELQLANRLIAGVRAGGKPVVSQLLDCLTDDRDNTEYAAVLTGILGGADTQDAHRGLLEIIADPTWPIRTRKLALESTVQITRPAEEADAVLKQLCKDKGPMSETALLILGATGDRVRNDSPERFDAIGDFIEERTGHLDSEDAVQDPGELMLALDTIGNLGPADIPPVVEQSLSHADADIRAHAVLSLARTETDAALQLIMDALRNDENEDVRVIALHLAGDPDRPGALELLCNTITSSPSERLRAEALAGLTAWGDDAAVIRVVQTVSSQDPSADIREYAAEWLQIHLESLVEENSWLSDERSR